MYQVQHVQADAFILCAFGSVICVLLLVLGINNRCTTDPILISARVKAGFLWLPSPELLLPAVLSLSPVNFLNLAFLCFLGILLLVFCVFPEVG